MYRNEDSSNGLCWDLSVPNFHSNITTQDPTQLLDQTTCLICLSDKLLIVKHKAEVEHGKIASQKYYIFSKETCSVDVLSFKDCLEYEVN